MGNIRDRMNIASSTADMKRAAHAGGPKRMARSYGKPRGSDRFPGRKRGKR